MNRRELLDALTAVRPALAAQNFLPVLSHFCFTGDTVYTFDDIVMMHAVDDPSDTTAFTARLDHDNPNTKWILVDSKTGSCTVSRQAPKSWRSLRHQMPRSKARQTILLSCRSAWGKTTKQPIHGLMVWTRSLPRRRSVKSRDTSWSLLIQEHTAFTS